MEDPFIKPNYNTNGFASLPQRILNLFSANQYDAVVLFLVDSFGWRFFEKFQGEGFFRQILQAGKVEKLTSQFPSTTAAHITTIHTGMPVGAHGIFEWYYYEPLLDSVIAPLLHSFSGTPVRDTLKPTGLKPSHLYPTGDHYQTLKRAGVSATIYQAREYTPSTFSDVVFKGAKTISFKSLPEALVNLAGNLIGAKTPSYHFLYFDRIDAIGHEYGPGSAQVNAEIIIFLMTMERILLKALVGNQKKILFLMTADHGQVETDPHTTIYLNLDPAFNGIEKFLKTDHTGALLTPAGSARDYFLYIKDGMLEEAKVFLANRLSGRAEVRETAGLISDGYFGPLVSMKFRERAGDLVILPRRGESVWWFEKDRFEQRFYGHHGGLTEQEMEIPLISWEM